MQAQGAHVYTIWPKDKLGRLVRWKSWSLIIFVMFLGYKCGTAHNKKMQKVFNPLLIETLLADLEMQCKFVFWGWKWNVTFDEFAKVKIQIYASSAAIQFVVQFSHWVIQKCLKGSWSEKGWINWHQVICLTRCLGLKKNAWLWISSTLY